MRRRIIMAKNNNGYNYEYVDLGLPSGILWATTNIGAETESDSGLYFQWGDTSGYTIGQVGSGDGQKTFNWQSYKYGNGTSSPGASGMTKYNSTDGKTVLEPSDDAATVNMGGSWRMPTTDEFSELVSGCTSGVTTIDGVNGIKFVNKADSTKYIFFPAAGSIQNVSHINDGSNAAVWSSSLYSSAVYNAYSFYFNGSKPIPQNNNNRSSGFSVRGVRDNSAWPVGNVLFYNTVSDKKQVFPMLEWPEASDGWTPIGIEVVPMEHNRYGDGSGGFMSLVGMDYNHPTSGIPVTGASQTDNIKMYWGHYSELVDNNIFRSASALTSSTNDYITYQSSTASTACTINSGNIVWPYSGTATVPTSGASKAYANTSGYVTATTGKSGCDFNGIRNTVACYVKTSGSTQWKSSTVQNATGTTFTPAAACAGRFKTVGTNSFLDVFSGITSNDLKYGTRTSTKTNKGFWYLPAEGELCYLPSKRHEINKTILALNQKYGNVGVKLNTDSAYMSSSEKGTEDAWQVSMSYGTVYYTLKRVVYYARAFMRY